MDALQPGDWVTFGAAVIAILTAIVVALVGWRQVVQARNSVEEAKKQADAARDQAESSRLQAIESKKQSEAAQAQAIEAKRDADAAELQVEAARMQAEESKRQSEAAHVQAEAARESLELDKQVFRASTQPYVYVDIRPDVRHPILLVVVIENTGRTVARNIRVEFDPPLQSATSNFQDIGQKRAFNDVISALPPDGRIMHYLDRGFSLNDRPDIPWRYRVKINAEGPSGPLDELEYEIDLSALLDSAVRELGTLRDVAEAIEALKKQLEKNQGSRQR